MTKLSNRTKRLRELGSIGGKAAKQQRDLKRKCDALLPHLPLEKGDELIDEAIASKKIPPSLLKGRV